MQVLVHKVQRVLCKVHVRHMRDHDCIPNNVHHIRRKNLPIEPEMGKRGKSLGIAKKGHFEKFVPKMFLI